MVYEDKNIRKKVFIANGNPVITSEENVTGYNEICKLVKEKNITYIQLNVDDVYVELLGVKRRIKYPNDSDLPWLKRKIKMVHQNLQLKRLEALAKKHNL